jgi:hypothetical protein
MSELVELVRKLRAAGSTGADLSPGDPLCAEAADALEKVRDLTLKIRLWNTDQYMNATRRKELMAYVDALWPEHLENLRKYLAAGGTL